MIGKSYILILITIMMLQSCIGLKFGNSNRWDNQKEHYKPGAEKSVFKPEIILSKSGTFIPLPFFLIAIMNKDYCLDYHFWTTDSIYKSIDSLCYEIYTADNVLVQKGKCDYSGDFSKINIGHYREQMTPNYKPEYRTDASTNFNIKIPKNYRNKELKIFSAFYFRKINNEVAFKADTLNVKLNKDSWFKIELVRF